MLRDTVQWCQGLEKQVCEQHIVSENMNTQTHQQHLFFSWGKNHIYSQLSD
jgi:hypothetical protein